MPPPTPFPTPYPTDSECYGLEEADYCGPTGMCMVCSASGSCNTKPGTCFGCYGPGCTCVVTNSPGLPRPCSKKRSINQCGSAECTAGPERFGPSNGCEDGTCAVEQLTCVDGRWSDATPSGFTADRCELSGCPDGAASVATGTTADEPSSSSAAAPIAITLTLLLLALLLGAAALIYRRRKQAEQASPTALRTAGHGRGRGASVSQSTTGRKSRSASRSSKASGGANAYGSLTLSLAPPPYSAPQPPQPQYETLTLKELSEYDTVDTMMPS